MPLARVPLVTMYVGQSTQRLLGSHQPICPFMRFAEEFSKAKQYPGLNSALKKLFYFDTSAVCSRNGKKKRKGPWRSVLFFLNRFCLTSKRDRAGALWEERTCLLKQGPIFYPRAPSNLSRASPRSALRGTHFIGARIEIRRDLWARLQRRADDGARTSSAPLLTGRAITPGVPPRLVSHSWMPGRESYCQM